MMSMMRGQKGQKKHFKPGLLALFFLFSGLSLEARVSLQNGNYYVDFKDIFYRGGFELTVSRVYNSKTTFLGLFGWNWGSELDVELKELVDGSLVVHEYGGGDETPFMPLGGGGLTLPQSVDIIAQAAGNQSPQYKKQLAQDAEYRRTEYFRLQGKIKPKQFPVGAQWTSSRYQYQYLEKVKDAFGEGYLRSFSGGKFQRFNLSGKLVKVIDRNQNFMTLEREGNSIVLKDNFHHKMTLFLNTQGLVERIEGENKAIATYQYNAKKELIQSKDVGGNQYFYEYDPEGRHNLIHLRGQKEGSTRIRYYSKTHPDDRIKDSVEEVQDPSGMKTWYGYEYERAQPDYLTVKVKIKDAQDQWVKEKKYAYLQKRRADGSLWIFQQRKTEGSFEKETTYEERFQLPVRIQEKEQGKVTQQIDFHYDEKGRVIEKKSPQEWVRLQYDSKANQIKSVQRFNPEATQALQPFFSAEYQYDSKGNMIEAKTSDGKIIELRYNSVGQVGLLSDQTGRRLSIRYNEQARPIEITGELHGPQKRVTRLGVLKFDYRNDGTRSDPLASSAIEGSASTQTLQELSEAYRNYLSILEPAGVTLQ